MARGKRINFFQEKIKPKKMPYSTFDLSRDIKTSAHFGQLQPFYLEEILPGDVFKVRTTHMLRFAPLTAPIMHKVSVSMHYFFVPTRLVWDKSKDFFTGGQDGSFSLPQPTIQFLSGFGNGTLLPELKPNSLADYFGITPNLGTAPTNNITVNALPFRAYDLIYRCFYADQDLSDLSLGFDPDAGSPFRMNDSVTYGDPATQPNAEANVITQLRYRCWAKDYFTAARPFAQKGPEVYIPTTQVGGDTGGTEFYSTEGDLINPETQVVFIPGESDDGEPSNSGFLTANDQQSGKIGLSLRTGTIQDLRKAEATLEYLERNARSGSRYVEQLWARFGVVASDQSMARPEFLGGATTPVNISEVLQTSQTVADSAQGTMAGHGISVDGKNGFKRRFEEHGYVIGIMSIRPIPAYNRTAQKLWFKGASKFDYYTPEFDHLGEQPVEFQELHPWQSSAHKTETFGYLPRYTEYRIKNSEVHGDMRDTLSVWHMAREWSDDVVLNNDFVECNPADDSELNRIFAFTNNGQVPYNPIWCHVFVDVEATRRMSRYAEPKGYYC